MIELLKQGAGTQKYGGAGIFLMFLALIAIISVHAKNILDVLLLLGMLLSLIILYLGLLWVSKDKYTWAKIFEDRDFDGAIQVIKNGPKKEGKYPIREVFRLWLCLEYEDWKCANEIINSFEFKWWIKGDFLTKKFKPIEEGVLSNLNN